MKLAGIPSKPKGRMADRYGGQDFKGEGRLQAQKPEALLERIILSSSNEDSIVQTSSVAVALPPWWLRNIIGGGLVRT